MDEAAVVSLAVQASVLGDVTPCEEMVMIEPVHRNKLVRNI